jgi:hypothetical protein
VRNCTFSGNVASKVANFPYGGGISAATSTYASVIQNCTFVSNSVVSATTASSVGGAAIRGGGSARLTVESCVFDDNPMNANGRGTISGCTLSNSVYEGFLYTDVTDGGGNVATNNAGVNLTLADNGGPTPTHALLEGSAAIGAGSNPAGLSCDQRGSGYAREVPAGDPDCGAYEYASAKPSGTMFVIK